jgi:nucleoside-diphosphate-sugar epimerase
VCTGVATSIKQVASTIIDATNSSSFIQYQPAATSYVTDRVGDPRKAHEQLRFEYSLRFPDGIADFVAWRAARRSAP